MSAQLDAKGTSENFVFDMRPNALYTRVAKGWFNIEVLREFESARTKPAREFFFKQYGLEAIYSGDEENHPQYIEDRSTIEEIFWETTRNVLKDFVEPSNLSASPKHQSSIHKLAKADTGISLVGGRE